MIDQDTELAEDDKIHAAQEDEYTQTPLKLKALKREKANLNAQLATQQRAITQAKKLAEARRKLARMQAEVEQLQKACESHQDAGQIEASRHAQVNNLHQEQNQHQEHHYQANSPFDRTSPLCPQLQLTPWPFGYKPTQLPKYNGSVDPTQFLMTYETTIALAGGDDHIMAKSFIMACEGPVTT